METGFSAESCETSHVTLLQMQLSKGNEIRTSIHRSEETLTVPAVPLNGFDGIAVKLNTYSFSTTTIQHHRYL
jgi:hypothetical protein